MTAIFFSLMVHKLIVAFSVGLQLARTHAHALRWVCLSIVLFALMTPLGALIGMFVHNAQIDGHLRDVLILVFQGVAVGTFLYVTFFEVCSASLQAATTLSLRSSSTSATTSTRTS